MTYDEFRDRLEAWWFENDSRAVARKDSQGALAELVALYDDFDSQDRSLADRVLIEWLNSSNERKLYDALAMIDHFRVQSAAGALRVLAHKTERRADHEAPYDLARIESILSRLTD
jgi:hypothetical protein